MSKPNASTFFKNIRIGVSKHSPEILTGLGIAGMIATTVLAVRATPKALELIDEATYEKDAPLTKTETIKTCWKCYIPAAVTGVTSVACLVGASAVNAKRNAALAAAYTLSDTALREYREKVVETIGEKKEQAVRDAVAKDYVEKNPISKQEVTVSSKGGVVPCYDPRSGRLFDTTHDILKKAENELNSRLLDEGYASLNDFYYELGIDCTTTGEVIGWSYNRDKLIKLSLSSQLAEGTTPCIVLDFSVDPYYDYECY